jgi:hypothetical protein
MTAVCQSAFGAVGETATARALSLPFLRREWAGRSWRSRVVRWAKSLVLSYSWRAGAKPAEGTGGPGEPPDESEIASCMSDPAFWMLLVH